MSRDFLSESNQTPLPPKRRKKINTTGTLLLCNGTYTSYIRNEKNFVVLFSHESVRSYQNFLKVPITV